MLIFSFLDSKNFLRKFTKTQLLSLIPSLPVSEIPRAAAALDTRGFVKLIRDKKTDKLIGARIVAPVV